MKQGAAQGEAAGRNQEAPEGLLQRLAELFLGSADADKERRRLLKQTARSLRKLGVRYYNPKTEQAEAGLARLFYEFYKALSPAQRLLRNAKSSTVLKTVLIESSLDKEQLQLKERLSEESLRERARGTSFQQLGEEVQGELASFFACFDMNRTKQLNDSYASLSLLLDLVLFDYYYFLRKFDPQLSEGTRKYTPRFSATNSQYVSEELERFLEIMPGIDPSHDWGQTWGLLEAYRGVETLPRDAWRRVLHLIRRLQRTRELEMALQLFTRNPFQRPKPRVYRDNVVEEFLSRFRLQTEATLQKLIKERKASKEQSLTGQLFGSRSFMRLGNYSQAANERFTEKLLGGYLYVLPLNCLHAFLQDYLDSDLNRAVEFLLIPAKWADNTTSRGISEAFHQLQLLARDIRSLDASLDEDNELGRRLAGVVSRAQQSQQAQYLARRLIKKINEQARELLMRAVQSAVALGKSLKEVIDDTQANNSRLIINWRELTSRSSRDIRQSFVSAYRLLYGLVQLLKLYV